MGKGGKLCYLKKACCWCKIWYNFPPFLFIRINNVIFQHLWVLFTINYCYFTRKWEGVTWCSFFFETMFFNPVKKITSQRPPDEFYFDLRIFLFPKIFWEFFFLCPKDFCPQYPSLCRVLSDQLQCSFF